MLSVSVQVSATELNKTPGKILDMVQQGPVRVVRRNQNFIFIKENDLDAMLESAKENRPQTIKDMLVGYDQEKIKNLVGSFMSH